MRTSMVDRRPEPSARNGFLGIVGAGALAVFVVSVVGRFGELFWVFDLFSHYRLQYAGLLVLATVAAAAARSLVLALPIGMVALLHLAPLAPLVFDGDQPEGPGAELRVVQFNARIGNPGAEAATEWLRGLDADLVVVQEADQRWSDVLDAGLDGMRRLDSGRSTVRDDSFGMVVFAADGVEVSRVDVAVVAEDSDARSIPIYVLELDVGRVDRSTVQVIAIHTVPPMSGALAAVADQQFDWAAAAVNGHNGPRLIVGDLNATRWSAPFRRLTEQTGLRDSAEGFGLGGTWPSSLAVTGMIGIDHVLVSDEIRVDDRWVGPDLGSDHRPVVADLTITDPER